jgi:type IV secretion system protein TrbJ
MLNDVCVGLCCKSCRVFMVVSLSMVTISTTTEAFADGLLVFDPLNYNQSILSAARALQQINMQIMSLTNQTKMLINSTKNIIGAPESIAGQLRTNISEIARLMGQANGLTFKVSSTANQFQTAYPRQYSSGTPADRMAQDANVRRSDTYQAFNQALLTQSQTVEALSGDGANLAAAMGRSSAAIGALQAQQANNELLGLQVKQSMQTQALVVTQARASALRDAEQQASEAAALARFKRFIGNGRAYEGGR